MTRSVFFLTDFGVRDTFVGEMKAVVLGLGGGLPCDLSHSVRPGDVRHGAFLLRTVLPVLPEGSVTAVVVDPGVGSARAVLAARWKGRLFTAPDNGLLPLAFAGEGEFRRVANPEMRREEVSKTFHGRDIFAVVAARLSMGFPFEECGPPVEPVRLDERLEARRLPDGTFEAEIIHVDSFGNLVSLYEVPSFPPVKEVVAGGRRIPFKPGGFYAGVAPGELLAYEGSHGYLEVAVNRGRADDALGGSAGDRIVVFPE